MNLKAVKLLPSLARQIDSCILLLSCSQYLLAEFHWIEQNEEITVTATNSYSN